MKRIKLNYTTVALVLITAILCFAVFSIILYRITAPDNPSFEQRLNTQLVSISTNAFDLNDNTIIKNDDGTLTYVTYSYNPTDQDLETLARFFGTTKDKIIIERDNEFDRSFYNEDPQLQLR